MYNENRKTDFINWYTAKTSPNYISILFNRTSVLEDIFQKDVSDFILEQIVELIRSLAAPSANSLRTAVSILRTYTNWCNFHNLTIDGQNHYDEVTTEILLNNTNKILVKKKFITEEQLKKYTDELINVCDKYILRGIYEGLKGENYCELLQLSSNDLNIKDNTFRLCTGRTIKVSDELMSYALESVNEFSYYSTKEGSFFTMGLKEDSNLVLKPRNNIITEEDGAYHRLLKRIFKIKDDLDAPELTLPRLYNSGVINAIYKGAEKENVSRLEFLTSSDFDDIKDQYDINKPMFQLKSIYKEYLE